MAEFDDSTEEANWRRIGPEGIACYGATVAGDWLTVAIASRYGGNFELWGFNGEGWWLLGQRSSAPAYLWPCPLAGAGNRDLLAFRDAVTDYDLVRLKWRSTSLHTYATAGTWTSPFIGGADPSRDVRVRRLGAVFAAPAQRGNAASVDGVIFPLEYSLDGGATWTVAVNQSSIAGATRVFTREATFTSPPLGWLLQVRQRWSSVLDWAPVLTSIWIETEDAEEYALAEAAAAAYTQGLLDEDRPRRRWELTVDAADRTVRRDGSADAQSGRQKIAALWTVFAAGDPLTFKDVDNDSDPTTYTVAIVDIEEKAPKPADAARWGESAVTLVLEEAATSAYPFLAGVYGAGTLIIDAAGALTLPTIPSVAAAIEARVDTDEAAATDDLTSIVVTEILATGTLLILRSVSSSRDPRLVDSGAGATGNLRLTADASYTLAATTNGILLELTATNVWTERGRW